MPASPGPLEKTDRRLHAGHASFDSDFRLEWSSQGFDSLVGSFAVGAALPDVLPVFSGVEDTLRGMVETEQPEWYLPAVAHERPGQSAASFLDIVAFVDKPGAALTLFVWDVTIEMQVRGRLMQERNEMWLLNKRLNFGGMKNDLARHHTETALIDISDQIDLMVAWVDKHMMIRAATPNFALFLQRPLVDTPLFVAMPTLLGLEPELLEIAGQRAPSWRIPGFRLYDERSQLCDLLFRPWPDGNGLYVVARVMTLETSIEQALRQQRNELTLIERRLEAQTATLKMARDRLVSIDQEREALVNLIANDIRSALSVIQGYAEWLENELRPRGQMGEQSAVGAIEQSVSKVKTLVEDVQAIQRVEQALAQMQTRSFDLVETVTETIAMWRGTAVLQNLQIEFVPEVQPLSFIGDPDLLKEAISSMIRCAVAQAMQPSTIQLSLARHRQWLALRLTLRTMYSPTNLPHKPMSAAMEIQLARARLVAEGHEGHLAVEITADGHQSISLWLPDEAGVAQSDRPRTAVAFESIELALPLTAAGGAVQIERHRGQVWVDGQPVNLSAGEYRLLLRLAEQVGHVVSHEQLMEAIQEPGVGASGAETSGAETSLESLRVLIWRLRKKLGRSATGAEYLQTVRGFGYILIS